jgi:ABC-2 type transport system permease protein
MLLSGFMFPFRGMPQWAQNVGSLFPLTHFLRIVRGVMLKGTDLAQTWPHIWPILIFIVFAYGVAMMRYRRTLD